MTFKEIKTKIKYEYRLSVSEEIFDKVLADIGCPYTDPDEIDKWFIKLDINLYILSWDDGMTITDPDWDIVKALNPEVDPDSYFDSYEVNEIDYDGNYDAIIISIV